MTSRVSFREDITRQPLSGGSLVVDRERGIVKNVKMLGLVSSNGRRYLPEAVRRALPLYEGVKSFIDHPTADQVQRSFAAVFGRFRGVRYVEGDGVRGDYYFNTAHPLAATFMYWCESDPNLIGYSHNAAGDTEERGGETVVTSISECASVDLVADPATTKGLAEGKLPAMDTFEKFVAGLCADREDRYGRPIPFPRKSAAAIDAAFERFLQAVCGDGLDQDGNPVSMTREQRREREAGYADFLEGLRLVKGDGKH